ncbi:hypothetical protein VPNG_10332 [Cytospora leucostoma]|uniref:Uncharacterized protein n=1 Tax=Cytospora leucostoma TaxID=1230097 RepID=A0A423VBG6_9PEZI|nr:hypothetical protein VPNG_10332 [Cytospora leucostoma]
MAGFQQARTSGKTNIPCYMEENRPGTSNGYAPPLSPSQLKLPYQNILAVDCYRRVREREEEAKQQPPVPVPEWDWEPDLVALTRHLVASTYHVDQILEVVSRVPQGLVEESSRFFEPELDPQQQTLAGNNRQSWLPWSLWPWSSSSSPNSKRNSSTHQSDEQE